LRFGIVQEMAMRFGVCAAVDKAGVLKAAGWDFVEETVPRFLAPETPEGEWKGEALAKGSALPIEAANLLVPAKLKITGPGVDFGALTKHMETVTSRASRVGIRTLVFGSGGARNIEEGFDREKAQGQVRDFAKMAAEAAGRHGVVIVVEPLRSKESNIINSVAEGMAYVQAVGRPSLECLVDSYHSWEENEPGESVGKWVGHIKHVHVADRGSRVAPGQSGAGVMEEYVAFFRVLKKGGYDGRVSVEATWKPELEQEAGVVLQRLKGAWEKA
jgi:sugar phosphate isomerase/epimerase